MSNQSKSQWLKAYDRIYRLEAQAWDPLSRIEKTEMVTRLVGEERDSYSNLVIHSRLSAGVASPTDWDETILKEISRYQGLGHDFGWKLFSHDGEGHQIAALRHKLKAFGFVNSQPQALYALDRKEFKLSYRSTSPAHIKRVTHYEGLEDVRRVQSEVYGESFEWLPEHLKRELNHDPDSLRIFVVYVGEGPVATAWIRFEDDLATLHGGSTLAGYRGAGLYRALLAIRLQEALARNTKVVFTEAAPSFDLVLSRKGFARLSDIETYRYFASKNKDLETQRRVPRSLLSPA